MSTVLSPRSSVHGVPRYPQGDDEPTCALSPCDSSVLSCFSCACGCGCLLHLRWVETDKPFGVRPSPASSRQSIPSRPHASKGKAVRDPREPPGHARTLPVVQYSPVFVPALLCFYPTNTVKLRMYERGIQSLLSTDMYVRTYVV